MTLKFLGEVGDDQVREICSIVHDVAARSASVDIELDRCGCFPPNGNVRVIWVGNNRKPRREYVWEDTERKWVPPNVSGEMLNVGHIWASDSGGEPWYPGTSLSLAEFLVPGGRTFLERNIHDTYIRPEEGDGFDLTGIGGSGARLTPAIHLQHL